MLPNANVAFLAIPGVGPGNYARTPTQLASYLSTIAPLWSIVTGLLLLRRYTKPRDVTTEAVSHLIRSLTPISEVAIAIPLGPRLPRSCGVCRIPLGVSRDKSVIVA